MNALTYLLPLLIAGSVAARAQTSYSRIITNDHPVLYWNFDEPSGNASQLMPVSLSTTANDLTPVAFATRIEHTAQADGLNLGRAASFQVGDYFMVENLALATNKLSAPWALEFWFQVQGSQEFQRNNYLMNFGAGGGNAPGILYDYGGAAQPRNELEVFASGQRNTDGPLVDDQNWHHALFVFYGDGAVGIADRLDIYLDGTNAAQQVRGGFSSALSLTRLVVGTSAPQFAGSDGFEGNLDEVAIYDLGSLGGESEITAKVSTISSNHFALAHTSQSYSAGVLSNQPLLYWNFNEESGNARQLAPTSAVTPSNALIPTAGATRVEHSGIQSGLALGRAASLPAGEYYSVPQISYGTNLLTPPWAIEFWMQAQGDSTAQRNDYLMNFGNNAPAVLYDYVGGEQPRSALELFRGGVGRTGAGPLVEDSSWHHVLMVYYGDGATGVADRADMYVDGTIAVPNVRGTFSSDLSLGRFVVGTSAPESAVADGFEGNLDEVAIYQVTNLADEAAVTTWAAGLASRHFAAAASAEEASLTVSLLKNQLRLRWPADSAGYVLESSPNLVDGVWTPVPGSPTVVDGQSQVTTTTGAERQFYRLHK